MLWLKNKVCGYGIRLIWGFFYLIVLIHGVVMCWLQLSNLVYSSGFNYKILLLSAILIGCGSRGIRKEWFE